MIKISFRDSFADLPPALLKKKLEERRKKSSWELVADGNGWTDEFCKEKGCGDRMDTVHFSGYFMIVNPKHFQYYPIALSFRPGNIVGTFKYVVYLNRELDMAFLWVKENEDKFGIISLPLEELKELAFNLMKYSKMHEATNFSNIDEIKRSVARVKND